MGAIIRATESQVDCPVSTCPPFQTRNWKIASDRWSSSSALFAVDPSRSRIIGLFPAKADAPELTTSCAACPKLLKVLSRINNGAAAPSAVKTRDATKYSLTTHKSNYQQIFFFFLLYKKERTHIFTYARTHTFIYTHKGIYTQHQTQVDIHGITLFLSSRISLLPCKHARFLCLCIPLFFSFIQHLNIQAFFSRRSEFGHTWNVGMGLALQLEEQKISQRVLHRFFFFLLFFFQVSVVI